MLAVLLVCAAPVIASYLTYYVIRPEGRRSFGELIDPQKPIPDIKTLSLDGKAGALASLKDQWLLISIAGGACDESCQQRLYLQRQMREALGKEKGRVDWIWLVTDDAPISQKLSAGLSSATVLRVSPDELAQWLTPDAGHMLQEHMYLIDPLGNWMMRFPANMDAAAASLGKRDLDRLMRASSSWDREGR